MRQHSNLEWKSGAWVLAILCMAASTGPVPADPQPSPGDDPPPVIEECVRAHAANRAGLAQSPPLTVRINQLDSGQFPSIGVIVGVTGSDGLPIPGLTDANFVLTEQSENEAQARVETIDLTPLTHVVQNVSIALVFDRSGSMNGTPVAEAKQAAWSFVGNFAALDRAALVSFATDVAVNRPFAFMDSLGKAQMSAAIDAIASGGSTALYDACLEAINQVTPEVGVKAIIAFTDGANNASHITADQLVAAANEKGVPIYTIGIQSGSFTESTLRYIADHTGGGFYVSPTPGDLTAVFNAIKSHIANAYLINYISHNRLEDGLLRTVTVTANHNQATHSAVATYRSLQPPQILLTDPTRQLSFSTQPQSVSIPIDAYILGGRPVAAATLFYRTTGEPAYQNIPMTLRTTSGAAAIQQTSPPQTLYSATIPATAVHNPGLDYYVTATDNTISTSDPPLDPSNNPHQIPVGANQGPAIVHIPVTLAEWNVNVPISAQVADYTLSVASVTLFYRKAGQTIYDSAPMGRVSGTARSGVYRAVVPASVHTQTDPPGCDYYIEAADDNGFRSTHGTPASPHRINYTPSLLLLGANWTPSPPTLSLSAWAFDPNLGVVVTQGQGAFTVYNETGAAILHGSLQYSQSSGLWLSAIWSFPYEGHFVYETSINGLIGRIPFMTGAPRALISGRVLDHKGNEVPGARIRLLRQAIAGGSLTWTIVEEIQGSPSNGQFAFSECPAGTYWIDARVGDTDTVGKVGPFHAVDATHQDVTVWYLGMPIASLRQIRDAIDGLIVAQAAKIAETTESVDELVEGTSWSGVVRKTGDIAVTAREIGPALEQAARVELNGRSLADAQHNASRFETSRLYGTLAQDLWTWRPELQGVAGEAQKTLEAAQSQIAARTGGTFFDAAVQQGIKNAIDAYAYGEMLGYKQTASIASPLTLGERSYTRPALNFWWDAISTPETTYATSSAARDSIRLVSSVAAETSYLTARRDLDLLLVPPGVDWAVANSSAPLVPGDGFHKRTQQQILGSSYVALCRNLLTQIHDSLSADLVSRTDQFSPQANPAALESYSQTVINQLTTPNSGNFHGPLGELFPTDLDKTLAEYEAGKTEIQNNAGLTTFKMAAFVSVGTVVSVCTVGAGSTIAVGAALSVGAQSGAIGGVTAHAEADARAAMVDRYLQVVNHFADSVLSAPFILDRSYTAILAEYLQPHYTDPSRDYSIHLANPLRANTTFSVDFTNGPEEADATFILESSETGWGGELRRVASQHRHLAPNETGTLVFDLNDNPSFWSAVGGVWNGSYLTVTAYLGFLEKDSITYDDTPRSTALGRAVADPRDATPPLTQSPAPLLANQLLHSRKTVLTPDAPEYSTWVIPPADTHLLRILAFCPRGAAVSLHLYNQEGLHVGYDTSAGIIQHQFPAAHSGRFSFPQALDIPVPAQGNYRVVLRLDSEADPRARHACSLFVKAIPQRLQPAISVLTGEIRADTRAGSLFSIATDILETSGQKPVEGLTVRISDLQAADGRKLALQAHLTPRMYTDALLPAGKRYTYPWTLLAPADSGGLYRGSITTTSQAGTLVQTVTVLVASSEFNFFTDAENWTFRAGTFFSPPIDAVASGFPGALSLTSPNNTHTFGYWESPVFEIGPPTGDSSVIPITGTTGPDSLFAACYHIRTTLTEPATVPQMRLRSTASNNQQSTFLTVDSRSDGAFSPTPTGREYVLPFSAAAGATRFQLEFDMLNFDPRDAYQGDLLLDSVSIMRRDLADFPTPDPQRVYTFDTDDENWTSYTSPAFDSPLFAHSDGALTLRGLPGSAAVFGYWGSPENDILIDPSKLYIVTFGVESDVPVAEQSRVPQFRARVNEAGYHAAMYLAVESRDAGERSPVNGIPQDYIVYFAPPQAAAGKSLLLSFDFLNFEPTDQPDATLKLHTVTVETIPNPF